MRLTRIYASGFRCFCSATPLDLRVRPGLTILVGENDAGKSAIVDAIRFALGTRSEDRHRISTSDFSIVDGQPERELAILATLDELTEDETARFMEWCTVDGDALRLHVSIKGSLGQLSGDVRSRPVYRRRTGPNGDGPPVEGALREYLAAAYLRPLRDAARELSAGRRSRLSRILSSLPDFMTRDGANQEDARRENVDPQQELAADSSIQAGPHVALVRGATPDESGNAETQAGAPRGNATTAAEGRPLTQIIEEADRLVRDHPAVRQVERRVNNQHLANMSLGDQPIRARLGIGTPDTLYRLLERLELVLDDPALPGVARGLGLNNVLFMAAELLLLSEHGEQLPLLLIEEPEAHLHPQLLARVLGMLTKNLSGAAPPQLVLTTHSPFLASSANLEEVVVVRQGAVFPLDSSRTRLKKADYVFLRRFLDSTKANLFFARGVVLVEGLSEVLLLPAIAKKIGFAFEERGVSLVNVGHVGFFRYARIFQKPEGATYLPIPVACIRDLDLPPKEADGMERKGKDPLSVPANPTAEALAKQRESIEKHRGGTVRVFPSGIWTLEYDLAACGLAFELLAAIKLVEADGDADSDKRASTIEAARTNFEALQRKYPDARELAREVFRPILAGKVSKVAVAEHLATLLEEADATSFVERVPDYLVEAIKYAASAPVVANSVAEGLEDGS